MKRDISCSDETISASDRIERYSQLYSQVMDDDFEKTLVHYRQESILKYLGERKSERIIEVGCGLDLLVLRVKKAGLDFSKWIIVEPSTQFTAAARQQTAGMGGVEIIEVFFEATEIVLKPVSGTVDLIILSGLLHEVDDPNPVLARAFELLKPGGYIYVVVPNATSLHRRLAVAMGLIGELATPSERNRRFMQRRVFDRTALVELCTYHHFQVIDAGGMFLKPFTNEQMKLCASFLSTDIMTGLWRLGQDMPELASEIFVEAQKIA
jgi:SAM-dependent methyltransferase